MSVFVPPSEPDATVSRAPTRPPPLSDEQATKLDTLLEHLNSPTFALPATVKEVRSAQKQRYKKVKEFKSWVGAPLNLDKAPCTPLTDREKYFLTTDQCQRFLRATKWDLQAAFSRTEETVVWRREFGVDELAEKPEIISGEAETGKEVVMGWDLQNRPCLYMFPWRQNTKQSHVQIQFVVWCLERAVDMMGPGTEKLCLLIDFGTSEKGGGGQPTSLGQAKKVLDILQNYYCERLGRAICINVPTIFWGFYRLVGPFVDPVTKDKIRFNPETRTLVPPSQLDKEEFKGDYDFQYKHSEYFPAINRMCAERRERSWQKWLEIGNGKCGADETELKALPEKAAPQAVANGETSQPMSASSSTAGTGAAPLAAGSGILAQRNTRSATSASMDSPAPSVKSAGYQLPAEAETAPDWVEPASDSTPPTSSVHSRSSSSASSSSPPSPSPQAAAPALPAVNESAGLGEADKQELGMGRPRADSVDSFQTSREEDFHTPSANVVLENPLDVAGQEQGGHVLSKIEEASPAGSAPVSGAATPSPAHVSNGSVEGVSVGIAGLVVRPDGSIGSA